MGAIVSGVFHDKIILSLDQCYKDVQSYVMDVSHTVAAVEQFDSHVILRKIQQRCHYSTSRSL